MLKLFNSIPARLHLGNILDADVKDISAIVNDIAPTQRTAFRDLVKNRIETEKTNLKSIKDKIHELIKNEEKKVIQILA